MMIGSGKPSSQAMQPYLIFPERFACKAKSVLNDPWMRRMMVPLMPDEIETWDRDIRKSCAQCVK